MRRQLDCPFACERLHRALGGHVPAGSTLAGRGTFGADIDDGAAGVDKRVEAGLDQHEAVNDVLLQRSPEFGDRRTQADAVVDAGVVDHDVDSAVAREDRGDRRAHLGFIGHFALEALRPLSAGGEFRHQRRGLNLVATEDAGDRTLGGERPGDRFADTLGTT